MTEVHKVLERVFRLDLRSLALLRVTLGATLLLDLALRSRDLVAHYTDQGVLPRSLLIDHAFNNGWYSLHLGSGVWPYQAVLFLVAAAAAMALLVGYRTRLAAGISWLLLISLQARNPLILNSGDVLLRVVLFWGIFLPLGARWSLDQPPDEPAAGDTTVYSAATVAYVTQIALLYYCAASSKTGTPWLDGTAVYYALSIDQFSTPLGEYLLGYPELLKLLTVAVVWVQFLLPFLVLSPIFTPACRLVAVVAILCMHAGFAACLHLGIFAVVALTVSLGLIPSLLWERLPPLQLPPRWRWGQDPVKPLGKAGSALVLGLLAYVVLWNLGHTPWKVNWLAHVFRLDQHWSMFAPSPLTRDGWFVVEGETKNGKVVPLFQDRQKVSFEKPDNVSATYPNQRWRKYLMTLESGQFSGYRAAYARYLQRGWDATHRGPWAMRQIRIYFVVEETTPLGQPQVQRRLMLLSYDCKQEKSRNGFRELFGEGF